MERSSIFASRLPSRVSDFSSGSRPVTAQKSPRRPPARASMRSNGCCSFLRDSRNASQGICDASRAQQTRLRVPRSVAGKPQAAAIRAEARIRELITTGYALSVSRKASSVPAGMSGVRRERGDCGDAFVSVAFAGSMRRGTGRARCCVSSQRDHDFAAARAGGIARDAAGKRLGGRTRHVSARDCASERHLDRSIAKSSGMDAGHELELEPGRAGHHGDVHE